MYYGTKIGSSKEKRMGATRGQHYLPQFLLKGFASRTKEKKAWVYCFRRDATGKEVSVRDIGKETDFHGNPRDSDLEDKMAAVESVFGPHVARWREGELLPGTDEELISPFVGHLIVRTKSIREAFAGGAQVLMDELLRRLDRGELNPFSQPDIEAEMMRRMSENPLFAKFAKQKPREFRARVSADLAKLKRSGKPLEWAHQMAVQARATINVNESIAQAHIKSLSESQIPAVRVQILQTLAWSIARTNHKEIILGDAGAVAREIDDTQFKHPLALEFSRLGMLCCPIGSSSVLVGRAVGLDHSFSAAEINQASAELSREFFVASERNQSFDDLQNVIGKRADIMSPEEIRKLIPKEMPPFRRESER